MFRTALISNLLTGIAAHEGTLRAGRRRSTQAAVVASNNQTLFVCHGFNIQGESSGRTATLKHKKQMNDAAYDESGALMTDDLAYNTCQQFTDLPQFHKGERIEVYFSGLNTAEINGAFEISTDPDPTSTLLLVLERRSGVLSFRSFAFPALAAVDPHAQLAVVDAHRGEIKSNAVLSLEDHVVANKEDGKAINKTVQVAGDDAAVGQTVRLEEIEFDRVYAIQPGVYDADIIIPGQAGSAEHELQKFVDVRAGSNYVIMRTGQDDDQELVFYPKAGAFDLAVSAILMIAASVFLF